MRWDDETGGMALQGAVAHRPRARSANARGVKRVAAALALAAAGCGTWSNEDIAFVEALPTSQALKVALPAPAGQALCGPPGPSVIWEWAKPTGDGINAGVDWLLGLVDLVKQSPPSTRKRDERVWGPFGDSRHPGNELRVTMTRTRDEAGVPTYTFAFEARAGGGAFASAIDGDFTGESARAGHGSLTIHFGVLRALGMNDKESDPVGDMTIHYDRTGDPRTVSLGLPVDGLGLTAFDYDYAGYSSGNGLFHYKLVFTTGSYVVDAWFDATGAGKAFVQVSLDAFPNQLYAFDECWDSAACVTNVNDPRAGTLFFPDGVSKLCAGGVCPRGACPAGLPVEP